MIFVTIFTFVCLSELSGLPLNNDRLVFPDELYEDKIVDKVVDLKVDQKSLFDNPNLLKFGNTAEEFLIDEKEHNSKLEYQDHFQGDIILDEDQKELLKTEAKAGEDNDALSKRTGLIWQGYRWPRDKEGIVNVPHVIADEYTPKQKNAITDTMRYIEKYTCIRFVERVDAADYIYIFSGDGCTSYLGKIGGKQTLSLQTNGCLSRGTIIHELIHTLGYDHMQNHVDRDKFVTIIWDNIDASEYPKFKRVDATQFANFGTPYDYYSVMHFDRYAFSNNMKPTVLPKNPQYNNVIGQRNAMSKGDQQRINNMYKCKI